MAFEMTNVWMSSFVIQKIRTTFRTRRQKLFPQPENCCVSVAWAKNFLNQSNFFCDRKDRNVPMLTNKVFAFGQKKCSFLDKEMGFISWSVIIFLRVWKVNNKFIISIAISMVKQTNLVLHSSLGMTSFLVFEKSSKSISIRESWHLLK